ncbi:MAG: esterase [Actinomycetia bacterium]|nr:esterase [Actinomycetes bacterium]
MKTSLVGRPFAVGFPLTVIVTLVLAWRHAHVLRQRVGAALLSLLAAVLAVAVGVNGYFAYFPSVGALLGRRATDEVSHGELASLVRSGRVPDHGVVLRVHIPGALDARSAQVYLPPAWFRSPRPTLPGIELLHGTPGAPEDWTRAGFADVTADRWAADHHGVAPVIVMPDSNGSFTGDTECVDGRAGRADTYLARDVVRWVSRHQDVRGRWAVAGSSEGGFCAALLALRHPKTFVAFADYSGTDRPSHARGLAWLLGPDVDPATITPANLLDADPAPAAWFEVGSSDDGADVQVARLARQAKAAGLDTRSVVLPNAHHTWRVWRDSFEDSLPWLVGHL